MCDAKLNYEDFDANNENNWIQLWRQNETFRSCCFKKILEITNKNKGKPIRKLKKLLKDNQIFGPFEFFVENRFLEKIWEKYVKLHKKK